jgi:hypothetical protein
VHFDPRLLGAALLAVLCACSGSSATSTATSTATKSPAPAPCQAGPDSVAPSISPLIEISSTSAARPYPVNTQAPLPCDSTLTVTSKGSATAKFGQLAVCNLVQGGSNAGTLISGYPPGLLFTLSEGMVLCTATTAKQQQIAVCGQGVEVVITSLGHWTATCPSDHAAHVAVYTGSVLVRLPSGTKSVVTPEHQLAFDPLTGKAKPSVFIFSAAEIRNFPPPDQ